MNDEDNHRIRLLENQSDNNETDIETNETNITTNETAIALNTAHRITGISEIIEIEGQNGIHTLTFTNGLLTDYSEV